MAYNQLFIANLIIRWFYGLWWIPLTAPDCRLVTFVGPHPWQPHKQWLEEEDNRLTRSYEFGTGLAHAFRFMTRVAFICEP